MAQIIKIKKERVYKNRVTLGCPICGKLIKGISKKHWRLNCITHLYISERHHIPIAEAEKLAKSTLP